MELLFHHMKTQKHWGDIVLSNSTLQQIDQLRSWLHQHKDMAGQKNKLKDGYRVLLYGPSGTGKSTTASILANEMATDIYKVDLSAVVSKYIGETEKNLDRLFDTAEQEGWILFFDEADSLFGKRTEVKDAHDRYANIEVTYLLRRMEDYQGLVILSSNGRSNIDKAFIRRFQSVIHFPLPTKEERRRIWEMALAGQPTISDDASFDRFADHEITPAMIIKITDAIKNKITTKREIGNEQLRNMIDSELVQLNSKKEKA